MYNNKILKQYVVNNDHNIYSNKIIHHFPGGPGIYAHKIVHMTNFLNTIKNIITPILFQTDKKYPDQYVIDMIKSKLDNNWIYKFYNDNEVIKFFKNNPCNEFPDIVLKYNAIQKGAHRADLFRYYYLYLKGGFFMDSDAMIYSNISYIVQNFYFVSVNSSCHPGTIFQGILGSAPKSNIIKKALYNAYYTDPNILLNDYHYWCRVLYNILDGENNIKLYSELRKDDKGDEILDGDNIIFKHYWKYKIIPPLILNNITFNTKYGNITLDSKDIYFIECFEKQKYWDDENLCYLRDYIINLGNILEIGGHSGTSTVFYASTLNDGDQVYTYEPQKKMFNLLSHNINQNNLTNKTNIFNKALFCYNGKINMSNVDLDGPNTNKQISILENENNNINYGGICLGKNGEGVECITLDSIDINNVSFIHCDAQGAEPFIFAHGKEFIKKHRPTILYENKNLYGDYLYNHINNAYPEYNKESQFDIKEFCVQELNYICIDNFLNNNFDTLLIPYNKTEWNHYNKEELNNFDYNVLSVYEPLPQNQLIRIGPNADGGYVVADGINYDLFISCGIADDIRFEEAFLDKYNDIKCIAFDGTINTFPQYRNKIEWINKNIGYINTPKITNLKEYIKDYDNIFLKMDIEGGEFNWIDAMTEDELNKFSQIVIEIHWPFDNYRCNMLKKLANTHYAIHIHGNNYCDKNIPKHLPSGRTYDGCIYLNGELKLPEVFEITYIKKTNILSKITKTFPTELDCPNDPNEEDVQFTIN